MSAPPLTNASINYAPNGDSLQVAMIFTKMVNLIITALQGFHHSNSKLGSVSYSIGSAFTLYQSEYNISELTQLYDHFDLRLLSLLFA